MKLARHFRCSGETAPSRAVAMGVDLESGAVVGEGVGEGEGEGEGVAAGDGPFVLFAGEATHARHYSCAHAAYSSGRREALRALRLLGLGGGGGASGKSSGGGGGDGW